MNNDKKFLVLDVEEDGAKVKIASKLKTETVDLSAFAQQVKKGQCYRLDGGALQMVAEPTGVEVIDGKLSIHTKIDGAYDAQDEHCKNLVKTEFFLKVSRGVLNPFNNNNKLTGQTVTIKLNSQLQRWEVVSVGAKPAPRRTTGLIYSMEGEQSVRIYSPGYPVDFQLDCEDQDRDNLRGKWYDFPVPEDFKTVKWEEMDAAEPKMETLQHGQIVMVRLPCWLDRESGTLRTERHEWVFDPFGNLTRYFEGKEEGAVENATLELLPLNSGAMRFMAHDKQPFIVEEPVVCGGAQTPEPDGNASLDEGLDEEEALLIETKDQVLRLSEKMQKEQEYSSSLYVILSGCKNISSDMVQELENRFIQLTSFDKYLFADSDCVNDLLETTVMLQEGIQKCLEFIKKANTAIFRNEYMKMPQAGKAFLRKNKKF
ncbi:unnamed protein product [Caenorhabditis brenneri]